MATAAQMEKAVDLAEASAGYAEGRCSASTMNNTRYGVWYGMNCAAWCAMFVSKCYHDAGAPQPASSSKGFAYTPSGAAWYQQQQAWATPGTNPRRGWVVFFYSVSAGRIAHVGLVRGARGSDGLIPTVEGNTNGAGSAEGGSVLLKRRSPSQGISFRIAGYGRPELIGEQEQEEAWYMADPIPEGNLEQIEASAVEALVSAAGQAALRKAFEAEVSEIVAATGANQFFVKMEGAPQVYVVGHGGELYHIPSQATLYAMGGTDAAKRILEYPADADIWQKTIHGQQPTPSS